MLRGSRLVPVWPRPKERWLSEKRGRNGSAELLLERWSMRPKENVELEDGVEAAGDGCGAAEGDDAEASESRAWGDATEGGDGIGGGDMAGGGDRADGGVLGPDVEGVFVGERERAG